MKRKVLLFSLCLSACLANSYAEKATSIDKDNTEKTTEEEPKGEFYQFNLSSCIRQQNSLTAQFVSFSLSNLANIFYPPQFLQ